MSKTWIWLLSGALLLVFGAVWAQDNQSPITQGDFAVLLASDMNTAPPTGGWNPKAASKFLTDAGITPTSGSWNVTAKLTEGNMAHIVRLLGLSFYSSHPKDVVTWAKALAFMGQYRDRIHAFDIHGAEAHDRTSTHVHSAFTSNSPGQALPPPASPSQP